MHETSTQTEFSGSSTGHGASVTWVEAPWWEGSPAMFISSFKRNWTAKNGYVKQIGCIREYQNTYLV